MCLCSNAWFSYRIPYEITKGISEEIRLGNVHKLCSFLGGVKIGRKCYFIYGRFLTSFNINLLRNFTRKSWLSTNNCGDFWKNKNPWRNFQRSPWTWMYFERILIEIYTGVFAIIIRYKIREFSFSKQYRFFFDKSSKNRKRKFWRYLWR